MKIYSATYGNGARLGVFIDICIDVISVEISDKEGVVLDTYNEKKHPVDTCLTPKQLEVMNTIKAKFVRPEVDVSSKRRGKPKIPKVLSAEDVCVVYEVFDMPLNLDTVRVQLEENRKVRVV